MSYLSGFSSYRERCEKLVGGSARPDADPVFNDIAKTACRNGMYCNYTGAEGVSFMRPTSHPRGYYNVLKFIAGSPDGMTRKRIYTEYRTKIATTITRLEDGKLIKNVDRVFHVTELGKLYLIAAKRYLCKRNEWKHRCYCDYVTGKDVTVNADGSNYARTYWS